MLRNGPDKDKANGLKRNQEFISLQRERQKRLNLFYLTTVLFNLTWDAQASCLKIKNLGFKNSRVVLARSWPLFLKIILLTAKIHIYFRLTSMCTLYCFYTLREKHRNVSDRCERWWWQRREIVSYLDGYEPAAGRLPWCGLWATRRREGS